MINWNQDHKRNIVPLLCLFLSLILCNLSFAHPGHGSTPTQVIHGLTVLVEFDDQRFDDVEQAIHAANLVTAKDYTGYTNRKSVQISTAGSFKDYIEHVSNGHIEFTSAVVLVRLADDLSHYDRTHKDDFLGSSGNYELSGPMADLIEDITKVLQNSAGGYQLFESGGFVDKFSPFDFSSLTHVHATEDLPITLDPFWKQAARRLDNDTNLTDDASNLIQFFNVMYVGKYDINRVSLQGLWPRANLVKQNVRSPGGETSTVGNAHIMNIGRRLGDGSITNDFPQLGLLAHESGHSLLGLKDYYDTQRPYDVFLLADGVTSTRTMEPVGDEFRSAAIGQYDLMATSTFESAPSPINAFDRERLGWEESKDLIDAAEGTVFTIDPNADGSVPNVNRSYKYCKPKSPVFECFYIEARTRAPRTDLTSVDPRTGMPYFASSPDEGLMIWHTENYDYIFDTGVNEFKDQSAGLHFGRYLVQADGLKQLEGNPGVEGTLPLFLGGDLFRESYKDRFDGKSIPNSNWWDGTPSGLSIKNISRVGDVFTFEIGKRPRKPVFFDFNEDDLHFNRGRRETAAVGEPITFQVTPLFGKSYSIKMLVDGELVSQGPFDTRRTFSVKTTFEPNIVSVETKRRVDEQIISNGHIFVDQGVEIYANHKFGGQSEKTRFQVFELDKQSELNGMHMREVDFEVASESDTHVTFFIENKPGFITSYIKLTQSGTTIYESRNAYTREHEVDLTKGDFELVVESMRIPGYLCSEGRVETYRWNAIYGYVGDLVRDGDNIYMASVPRAQIIANREIWDNWVRGGRVDPLVFLTPDQRPDIWTLVERCSAPAQDCTATNPLGSPSHWVLGEQNNDSLVIRNNKLWERNSGGIPGVYPINRAFGLGNQNGNILWNLTDRAPWTLLGNCGVEDKQPLIRGDEGIRIGRASRGVSDRYGRWRNPDPTDLSPVTFTFEVENGYELDDVYINGVPQNLSANDRSFINDFDAAPGAQYIEIKTIRPETHDLQIAATTGGNIAVDGGDTTVGVNAGESRTFNFRADHDHYLNRVIVNGEATAGVYGSDIRCPEDQLRIAAVHANHVIDAEFVKSYEIDASSGTNGNIVPSGLLFPGNVECDPFEFNITPNNGFQVSEVFVDGTLLDHPTSPHFYNELNANSTIHVNFEAVPGSCSGIPAWKSNKWKKGKKVLYQGVIYEAKKNVNNKNKNKKPDVTPGFWKVIGPCSTPATFDVTATAGANGTISPNGIVPVTEGGAQHFTITPNPGFAIANASIDGNPVIVRGDFTLLAVNANKTVNVTFRHGPPVATFDIQATATGNGSITPSGTVSVVEGSDQTFDIVPDAGYEVDQLTVDGANITPASRYVYSNVRANGSISVTFKKLPVSQCTSVLNWNKNTQYQKGSRVKLQNKLFEAKKANKKKKPINNKGKVNGNWKLIGPC